MCDKLVVMAWGASKSTMMQVFTTLPLPKPLTLDPKHYTLSILGIRGLCAQVFCQELISGLGTGLRIPMAPAGMGLRFPRSADAPALNPINPKPSCIVMHPVEQVFHLAFSDPERRGLLPDACWDPFHLGSGFMRVISLTRTVLDKSGL